MLQATSRTDSFRLPGRTGAGRQRWPALSSLVVSTAGGSWDELPADPVVADMIRFGERRQRLADQIAMDLLQRPDLRRSPEVVQDFVLEVWPLVLAQARLTRTSPCLDPGGHADTLDKLLWSVRRDAALRRPARLLELVPQLLQQLREGLALVGREPREFQGFFRALELLHQPALQLCARRRRLELSPPVMSALPPQPRMEQGLGELQPGTCIELYCHRRWRRAKLDWADAQQRQFLFAGEDGRPHAMTQRILLRLLREGLARIPAPSRADTRQFC